MSKTTIAGGNLKGRVLIYKGDSFRPTQSKVRMALFSMLGSLNLGATSLDLFGGTASVAMESLSRGAKEAHVVEQNPSLCRQIEQNAQLLSLEGRLRCHLGKAEKKIEFFYSEQILFDWIYMDPPYGDGVLEVCLGLMEVYPVLRKGGWLVVEDQDEQKDYNLKKFTLHKRKTYGASCLKVYVRNA